MTDEGRNNPEAQGDVRPLAAVLAGGRGERLGGPKALTPLAGRPMITYPLAALAEAGLESFVVTKADQARPALAEAAGAPVVIEPDRPRHPLLGLATALEHAGGRPVLAIACDLPFLTAPLLDWLAGRPGATVVPRAHGQLQPLVARYPAAVLAPIRNGIEAGAPVKRVVDSLDPVTPDENELSRFGDPNRLFHNVNTPDDLARAEALLSR